MTSLAWSGRADAQGVVADAGEDVQHPRPQLSSQSTLAGPEARRLDAEGTADMDAGDYRTACAKLALSYRLDPGIGVLLRLALCYERDGRSATAWTRYHEAAELARLGGNKILEDLAIRRVAAIEPTLSTITVRARRVAGLEVTLDDAPLAPERWDRPVPVDPGAHEIVAVAPGMRRFTAAVTSPPGDGSATSVVDVALEAQDAATSNGASRAVEPVQSVPARAPSWPPTAALSLGLLGAAGLAAGATFGAWALVSMNEARNECPSHTGCATHALDLQDQARWMSTVSTVGFGVGMGAALGGLIFWWLTPRATRTAWRFEPLVVGRARSLSWSTRF